MDRNRIYEWINTEREYQDQKYGHRAQSVAGYLLVMQKELNEARDGWLKNRGGRDSALHEILQVVAVGVACLEEHGWINMDGKLRDDGVQGIKVSE